jgi:glycerate kinase
MKIICAPDKFKGSLTAPQAAQAMKQGILEVCPEARVVLCPIADGGEGTAAALLAATGGRSMTTTVQGPRGLPVTAHWGILGQSSAEPGETTAVMEMAAASGMALLSADQLDPTLTSTWGTGQLIDAAASAGARKLLIGIGGSATHDGGCGAAQALGARFFDQNNQLITQPITGGMLQRIQRIDLSPLRQRLANMTIAVACDVNNPLTGPDGAAHVYAPQKGASPQQVRQLDAGLSHLASLWQDQLGKDVALTPGSGAAGGLGGGLLAMFNATLQGGVELVLSAVRFKERARGAMLCLTGEGRLDGQSLAGKACIGVARAAHEAGVKSVIALVGAAAPDADKTLAAGLDSYHVIGPGLTVEQSIARAAALLQAAAARQVQAFLTQAGRS